MRYPSFFSRRVPLFLTLVVLGLVLLRIAFLKGLVLPVRVSGGSMADAVLGRHRQLDCQQCGQLLKFDLFPLPESGNAVCGNCGGRNPVVASVVVKGERVVIDGLAYRLREPERWDLVAFRDPEDETRFAVKRIVGMPGEQILLVGGELYRDGEILRKPPRTFRSMAIPVHDTRYRTEEEARWYGDEDGAWNYRDASFHCTAAEQTQWLTYHHRNAHAGPRGEQSSPVLDDYAFNQSVSRRLNQVTDLLLQIELPRVPDRGLLAVRLHNGVEDCQLDLDLEESVCTAYFGPDYRRQINFPQAIQGRSASIEYAVYDRSVSLLINGRNWLQVALSGEVTPEPRTRPASIGVQATELSVSRIRVFRDVFYLPRFVVEDDWDASLGADEFLVLGDNCPISQDSRHWHEAGLARAAILGRVMKLRSPLGER